MWHDELKTRFKSNTKAAEAILADWKKKAPDEVQISWTTLTAFSNQIGLLRKHGDKAGWWARRDKLRQLFADALGVEEHEIFGRAGGEDSTAFAEFPGLPPLGPSEVPCRLSTFGSAYEVAIAEVRGTLRQQSWVRIPPGGGKSLAVALLRSRHATEVAAASVQTLQQATALVPNDPLQAFVVEVESSDPRSDLDALAVLERCKQTVVVLAPFGRPTPDLDAGFLGQPPPGAWRAVDGAPASGWIERMLDWINQRLDATARETKLDSQAVLGWIRQHPWRAEAITTPGELLSLCADFDKFVTDDSPFQRGTRWLDTHGRQCLPPDAPVTWKGHTALGLYQRMIVADALDLSAPRASRPFGRWPILAAPERSLDSDAVSTGPDRAVAYLRQGGLLRGSQGGAEPYPRWVARCVVGTELSALLLSGRIDEWGALAADKSRVSLVDEALSALAPAELKAVRRKVLKVLSAEVTFPSLARVAALEAVLAATGRAIAVSGGGVAPGDVEEVQRLVFHQLTYLVSDVGQGGIPVPVTRRNLEEWFATGWSMSLAVPAPDERPSADLSWILPGWARSLRLSDFARSQFPSSDMGSPHVSSHVLVLAELTPQVVERMEPSDLTEEVPRLFLPALFLSEREWKLGESHLKGIHGSWEEYQLGLKAGALPEPKRNELALRFWRLVGRALAPAAEAPVSARIEYLKGRHPYLERFVLENVAPEEIERTAQSGGTHQQIGSGSLSTALLRELPPVSRAAAIRGWLKQADAGAIEFVTARQLARVMDAADLDRLLEVLRDASTDVLYEFARRVWDDLPERALKETAISLERGAPSAAGWFFPAPREHLGELVRMLRALPAPPPWVPNWAMRRLLDAGPASEDLYLLARGEPERVQTRGGGKGGIKA